MKSSTEMLLAAVCKRLRINAFFKRFLKIFIILTSIYFLALFLNRFTGVTSDVFDLKLAALPLVLSLLITWLLPQKITLVDSARCIDHHAQTDDLFLTQCSISSASGEFKTLLSSQAEKKAKSLDEKLIIPLNWLPSLKAFALLMIPLVLLSLYLPQFDPFGKEGIRQKVEQKKKVIEEERTITKKRLAVLKKQKELPSSSDEIKKELTKIFKDFKKAKPQQQVKKIRDERRKIAKAWSDKNRDLQSEKKSTLRTQSFGAMNDKMRQISKDLKNGETKSASEKLNNIIKELKELSESSDPGNQDKMAKLKQDMADIKDMLNNELGADSVKAAIDRALRQMNELDDESLQALKDAAKSMELSQRELQRLQKMMDEMKELQKMMQTAQNAEQYAQQKQGGKGKEGQNSPEYENFEEYEKFFNQQASQGQACGDCSGSGLCETCNGTGKTKDGKTCPDCKGKGSCKPCGGSGKKPGAGQMMASGTGTGNPGKGGGIPGENDDAQTGLKQEQSKSKNKAGKILMQWKTKGLSDKGEVTVEYQDAVKEIQAGVDEAIVKENIPPGYHDVIKKYFSSEDGDSIDQQ
jgi:hypothetical protein